VDPSAELFLMEAARAQHVAAVLRRAIAENDLVLCDRYADASLAYQGGGRGLDADFIRRANRFATGGLVPDLTVLLDMDPGAAVGRALARNKREKDPADRFEREEVPFHERVRRAYLELAHREPGRFLVLPAARAPEEIEREIIGRIDRGLAGKRA
jgi:dTMP kinase